MKKDIDAQSKVQLLFDYIAKNEKEIKKQLKKNTTSEDGDFLNEIFQEATLKMAESILKNNTEIKDMKNFVFISMKNLYIIKQNQLRKKNTIMTNEYENLNLIDETPDNEERFRHINTLICDLKCSLIEKFGYDYADMFMDYFNGKMERNVSYKTLAERYNLSPRVTSQRIKDMKNYIINDEGLNRKFTTIMCDDYCD